MEHDNLDFSQARIVDMNSDTQPEVITETEVTQTETGTETTETTEAGENDTPETTTETTAEANETETSTEAAATETTTTDTQQESQEEIFSRVLQERYGVASLDDYLAQQQAKQPELSETVKKLAEWEAKGLDPQDYFRTQSQKFDEMSDLDKVRNLYAIENPDLTPEDIELLIEDEFKINDEDYDEKTVRLGQLRLKQKGKEATPKLKQWQVEKATPQVDTKAQEVQQQVEAYHRLVDDQLKDFNAIEIPLNDKGEKFTFNIAADKKSVESMAKDVNAFLSKFVATDAQGNQVVKAKELAQAMYAGLNLDKIAKAIAAQAQSKGVTQVVSELNNTSNTTQKATTTAQQNTPLSRLGALAAKGLI